MLGKRQATKMDRENMRRRTWGMRRIMERWWVEAEQRLGKCKRKLLGGRREAGTKRQRRLMEMGIGRGGVELARSTGSGTLCGSTGGQR